MVICGGRVALGTHPAFTTHIDVLRRITAKEQSEHNQYNSADSPANRHSSTSPAAVFDVSASLSALPTHDI